MGVTYTSCAVVNGQSVCVGRNSGANGLFPVSLVGCGGLNRTFNNKKKILSKLN
jgi:hypothetical protein